MEKEKKTDIFTKEFYENAFATLATLNTFADNKEKYINEMDMYESGTFLFMSVYDNEENRKILSHVISNIDNYKEYCKKLFIGDDIDNEYIDVSGLVYEFEDIFYGKYNILWDKNAETFYFDEEE